MKAVVSRSDQLRERYRRELISMGLRHHHIALRVRELGITTHAKVLTQVLKSFLVRLNGRPVSSRYGSR